MEPYTIDVHKLVNDVKGFVAQIKAAYFEKKDPVDDNEVILQKLCVKLEIALRHKIKDKYSFLGVRKDYWNFFSECLPKDEGVRYVNSLSQINTVQGKGRALIRYCLVQKTLADTIQRALIHERKMEWFSPDALLLNKSVTEALISKLYDLNELEFHLSCTGCDLDMSWPAFGRTFADGYERRTRRNSGSSIASTIDFANERIDPLIALNAELSALKQLISKELGNDKASDELIVVNSNSSNDEAQLNISDVTLELSRFHQFILKWKSSIDSKILQAENEIQRLAEEKDRLSRDSSVQREQLAEKHDNLSKLASKEAAMQVSELENKLQTTENVVAQLKSEIDHLNRELQEVSLNYEDCQENLVSTKQQVTVSRESKDVFEQEISHLEVKLESQKSEQKTVESKLKETEARELSLRNKHQESEAKLRIKSLEQEKLQDAFENVNGLVFSSYDDFESYYKTQLLDKDKGLEVKDSENKTLERRLNVLTDENSKVKQELEEYKIMLTSAKHKLESCVEKLHKQDEECNAAKLQAQKFTELFERTNKVLATHYSRKSDGVENTSKESLSTTSSEQCLEEQCKILVNELNEAEKQLNDYEEVLINFADEKNTLESNSKALILEVERLVKETGDLKKEKSKLCLDREEKKRFGSEMDDRVRLLEEEKSELEEKLSSTLKEKADVEAELKLLNDKFEEESYLRLVNDNELSEIVEQLKEENSERINVCKELDKLKEEIEENKNELNDKDAELVKCKDELSAMQMSCDEANNSLEKMKEKVESFVAEKDDCEGKVIIYQEKLSRLQCTMDQEVSSLRFQLSSEALKYDEEIKELSKEKEEAIALKEKIQENEENIRELENKLKERNETWQNEKKKLTTDTKLLKHEIKVLNDNMNSDKEELKMMENTLMLSKKRCEKEKGRNKEYLKTIKEIKETKSEKEKLLELEKMEMAEDIVQLKDKLVSLLSDKSELWKKSNQLEFDMKTRLSETWVDDKDITHCPRCNTEFSLFMRKHHCRFCGNVFCHACSDNFVKTIHSRKPYRSCNACHEKEKELKSDSSLLHNTSLPVDQHNSSLSISSCGSDSEITDANTSSTQSKLSSTPISEMTEERHLKNQEQISEIKTQSDESDNSEEKFEIIDNSEDSLNILMFNDDLNVKADVFTPNRENREWYEATIPAGKRYLICANVVAGSQVVIEFTTSLQGVLFGAAIREYEGINALQALIPLCQVNSHERCCKKQLQISCSGVALFILDNTDSKTTERELRFKVYLK